MKMRMFAVLLAFCLLCGAMCGCDYTESTSDTLSTSTRATDSSIDADEDITTATTIATTTTTTQKITTKRSTTKLTTTTSVRRTTAKPAEAMVWIPASGSKYHSKSSCSNMKNPSKVTKSYAIELGYTACKKCY